MERKARCHGRKPAPLQRKIKLEPLRFKLEFVPLRRAEDAKALTVESGQIVYDTVPFQSFESFDDGVPIFWSVLGHFNQIASGSYKNKKPPMTSSKNASTLFLLAPN